MTATTLMNLGLILTHASVYQMLRGCVVVFTGIMSVIFLKRKQYLFHWVGMFLVIAGVTIVGLASTLMTGGDDAPAAKNPVLGDILIISAQIFTATQFVVEEKILGKYDAPPMLAIGLEGLFGGLSTAFLMPIFHFAIGVNDFASMFDMKFAFMRLFDSPAILISTIGSVISISFFNFFGLSVTKFMSATSRSTIDAMRTLFVWMFSLIFGWEAYVFLGAAFLL
ncbi:hypothetical protein H696_03965 [Fonticula alba]|uniref:EamA domain-containing protein n=1 Tax=Fonticula alba TaxID=691883 RepID=A0A058Z5J5_FONAL|nr:hypothetical protein H696_03965 [Fonticula alba]KCV69544.1 hypothetical protein H696_03965 [Fonticula alba]|eukprot:XP_009496109.1 hypothetical protein H696_03965 [Fonticula alba]